MRYPHHTPNDSLRNLQVRKIKEIKNVWGKSVAAPLTLQKNPTQNVSTAICCCLEIATDFIKNYGLKWFEKKCTLYPIFRRGAGKGREKKEWDAFKVSHFSVLRLISPLKCLYLVSPTLLHPVCPGLSVFFLSLCLCLLSFSLVFVLLVHRSDKYHLFEHNCNVFSNEVAQFLTGKKIPSYITDLPSDILSTWVNSI